MSSLSSLQAARALWLAAREARVEPWHAAEAERLLHHPSTEVRFFASAALRFQARAEGRPLPPLSPCDPKARPDLSGRSLLGDFSEDAVSCSWGPMLVDDGTGRVSDHQGPARSCGLCAIEDAHPVRLAAVGSAAGGCVDTELVCAFCGAHTLLEHEWG